MDISVIAGIRRRSIRRVVVARWLVLVIVVNSVEVLGGSISSTKRLNQRLLLPVGWLRGGEGGEDDGERDQSKHAVSIGLLWLGCINVDLKL